MRIPRGLRIRIGSIKITGGYNRAAGGAPQASGARGSTPVP